MPLARALSVALIGVDGHVVEVEADLAQGLPALSVIGLPDAALAEARDRIRAAIVNCGEAWPQRRITLALSPAALPKRGSSFDLAMAAAVLAANTAVPAAATSTAVRPATCPTTSARSGCGPASTVDADGTVSS